MNTLRPRIIVSLLMEGGRLIKTRQFGEPKYVGDPINVVKIFNEKEVDELAIFDIGAWRGVGANFRLLEKISNEARMPLCYGGGITNADQAARIVEIGFEKVSLSRAAVIKPELITEVAERIGSQSTVVTLDVKRNKWFSGWSIYTENGVKKSPDTLESFLPTVQMKGAGEIVLNCIDREGQVGGYDLELAKVLAKSVSVPITILGGAGSVDHMQDLIREVGVAGAAAGTMFVFKGIHRAVLISYSRPSAEM